MNYKEKILNKLIDKYEKRQQSYGLEVPKRAIALYVEKDTIFIKYWAPDNYLYRDDIENEVNSLKKEGYINTVYENGLLKKIILKLDSVDDIYLYLHRESKKDKVIKEISYIREELKKCDFQSVAYKFLLEMQNLLEQHYTYDRYFKTLEELNLLFTMINAIEKNNEEILLRNFSKKHFSDSKLLEKYKSKVFSLFNEFDELQYDSFADLCAKHYIIKNSGYAFIKNGLILKINKQIVDLDKLSIDFALSDNAINEMQVIQVNAHKVFTIENLTTFHYFNATDAIIVYLGGYHNQIKSKLLKKIHETSKELEWYHIGDIDWGGFEIFMHLVENTGINFQPYLMGIEELKKYKKECMSLTQNDRKRLEMLLSDKRAENFYSVINYMLEKGYKLEQESLIFD